MGESGGRGHGLRSGEESRINFRGTRMVVKVSGEQSEGAYTLIEMAHPPDAGPPLHVHLQASEAYYVLEGE